MTHNIRQISSYYTIKLTSIGNSKWQLFVNKVDDSSDYVRLVFGVTEQIGGGKRTIEVLGSTTISPENNEDPSFLYEFYEHMMKNRRVWVAFEAVKRMKSKQGVGVGTFIALSPAQSKWKIGIGTTTRFIINELNVEYFKQLFANKGSLDQSVHAILGTTQHHTQENETIINYKTESLKRYQTYFNKLGDATEEERNLALINDESVANEELELFLDVDYSDEYNSGDTIDSLPLLESAEYKKWVLDWGLPAPTGKPPTKLFRYEDYLDIEKETK